METRPSNCIGPDAARCGHPTYKRFSVAQIDWDRLRIRGLVSRQEFEAGDRPAYKRKPRLQHGSMVRLAVEHRWLESRWQVVSTASAGCNTDAPGTSGFQLLGQESGSLAVLSTSRFLDVSRISRIFLMSCVSGPDEVEARGSRRH